MNDFLIGFIGVIIGALGTYFTLKYQYRQLFAETVSQSRNKWLNEMRENISEMLAIARKECDSFKSKDYYSAQNMVLLRLNTKEPLHLMLKQQIEQLEQCNSQNYKNIEKNIIDISEVLLKREWERVKREAQGRK